MSEKWTQILRGGDFKSIGEALKISPITARILRNREMKTLEEMKAYLSSSKEDFHSGSLLFGINNATSIMRRKIIEKKKIRIIGDYDVDGICATYILYEGLIHMGADCDYTIPHRIEDGYGINVKLVDEAYEAGVDTIITCDNGIAAFDQTEHANDLLMTMIITDHHEVPFDIVDERKIYKIPNADAVIDPRLSQDEYPFKGICGAFVAYKFIDELSKVMGVFETCDFVSLMEELTEFAALATVCDVMELRDENRALVKIGMEYMASSKNEGLRQLIKVTGIEGKKITPYHLGFIIGPCLNASGRLDTSLRAVELFSEKDPIKCNQLAEELKRINEERKEMTLLQTQNAINLIENKDELDKVLVVYLSECHESLAGIIAGRVKERFKRPSFVITSTTDGLKGSGRSIEAYDMYENLTKVKHLLSKFGGHKMAAGISLSKENLDEFTRQLNANCDLEEKDFIETLRMDMELPFQYASLQLCEELELLEPFGVGNEKPLFARLGVTFLSGRIIGKNNNAAKYRVSDGDGKVYELVYFGDLEQIERFVSEVYDEETTADLHSGRSLNIKLDVAYQLSINEYMGRRSPQLQMKYYR